jgi:hypothetical protein
MRISNIHDRYLIARCVSGICTAMAKLDPIVSEFESDEAAEAYDVWFRAQVEAALAETGPGIPHEQVMAEIRKMLAKHCNAPSRGGSNTHPSP